MKEVFLGSVENCLLLGASFTICFITYGIVRIYNMLFVAFLTRYGARRDEASFPLILTLSIKNLCGPFIGFLGSRYGARKITILGCLIIPVGICGCFFAERIATVTLFWGVLYGLGSGLGMNMVPQILKEQFSKHFAKASGVYLAGGSVGAIILPVIADASFKEYGVSGTFLILGGIALHCLPAAMIMRIPMRQTRTLTCKHSNVGEVQYRLCSSDENGDKNINATLNCEDAVKTSEKYSAEHGRNNEKSDLAHKPDKDHVVVITNRASKYVVNQTGVGDRNTAVASKEECDVLLKSDVETTNDDYENSKTSYTILPVESDCDLHSTAGSNATVGETSTSSNKEATKSVEIIPPVSSKDVLDIRSHKFGDSSSKYDIKSDKSDNNCRVSNISNGKSDNEVTALPAVPGTPKTSLFHSFVLFKDPVYLMIMLSQGLSTAVITTNSTILVDFARDRNVEPSEEVYMVTTIAFVDLMARFLMGYVIDKGFFSKIHLTAICSVAVALLFLLLVWLQGFVAVTVTFSILGVFMSEILMIGYGIIAQYIDSDKTTMAMASLYFVFGLLSFLQSPLIGYFRETLKSYDGLVYLLSVISLLASGMYLTLPIIARYRDRKKMQTHS